jgi:radical SAM protein with 4Fe4S-binding SPASM domain
MMDIDTLYLHITKACNLRCIYCYFSAGESLKDELTTQEGLLLIEDICLLKPKRIVFTGGEPLLREDTLVIAQYVKDINKDSTIKVCLTTNGTLITEQNAQTLVNTFDEIRISVDSFKDINDKIRGQGVFDKAMNALKCIRNAGGEPIAYITATSYNIHQLQDFMSYLLQSGIRQLHVSPLFPMGRVLDRQEMICSVDEIKAIVSKFWFDKFGLQLTEQKRETLNCGVGKFITVYPDGSVYPCHLLAVPEFFIGNIRDTRLYPLYHSSALMKTLRALDFQQLFQCAECFQGIIKESSCLGRVCRENKMQLLTATATAVANGQKR